MKPLSIEISAFGPYKDFVKIDFTKIGENGIFLITGDTGAGKTTIFDAIVFALYGNVSGSNRQISSIRSDFAEPETKTYVKLEFSHKDKIYTITRNPQYERPKKSGVGTTTQIADAYIECEDELLTTGVNNTDKKVQEILGIDVKQFKQISMLAQGEFLKILFADSKDRTEIFRKIFDTYIYQNMTKELENKKREAYANLSTYKTKFLTNTQNIRWDEDPEFIQILNEKNIHNYMEDIVKLLETEVSKNDEETKKINKEVEKLDKDLKTKELKIQKAEEINSNFEKLDKLKEKKKEQEREKDNYEEKQKTIDKNQKILATVLPKEQLYKKTQDEIKELDSKISSNNEVLEELKKQDEEYKQKDIKVNELKKKSETLKKQNEKIAKYKDEIANIDEILGKISERDSYKVSIDLFNKKEEKILKLKDVLKEYDEKNNEFEKIKQEKEKCVEIEEISKERNELSKEFEKANKEFRKVEDKFNLEEDKFYREQAGIIAETLEEGQKCPVCGNTHHPELAKRNEAISKEELDKLKLEKENKEKEKNEVNEKITNITTKIDVLIKNTKYSPSKEKFPEYIDKINKDYEKQDNEIKEKLDEANSLYLNIAEKKLNIEEFDYDKLKKEFDEKRRKIEEVLTRDNALIDKFLENMKKELSEKTDIKQYAEEVKSNYENINKQYEKNSKDICDLHYDITDEVIEIDEFDFEEFKEMYDNNKKEHSKKITECNTKKIEFQKSHKAKTEELKKSGEEYKKAYSLLGFENEEEYQKSIMDEETVEETKKAIQQYNAECIEVNTKIKELEKSLKDKKKVETEKDKEELENLKETLKQEKETQIELNTTLSSNKEIFSILNKDSEDVKKQAELYSVIEDLYRTASGTLTGKRRIEFEQYVQSTYFDMILIEANKRLVKMTGNRFELIRKENSTQLNKNIGLDLEVIDNYTGKQRDIKSLSGGESFKAALSLSLGVSDIIQSYSGGVVVDTLFIDEGFGSLDAESREQAINTLNLLTDTNKLIGIISHVTELKERIDKKIIVRKTSKGSEIDFEI